MIFWKLFWQILFIVGFILFIFMFVRFSYRGFHELKKLLERRDG